MIVIMSAVSLALANPLAFAQSHHSEEDSEFTWHDSPSLTIPRAFPAVVVFANGNILVTGGLTTGNTPTATTEIFDQKLGIWKPGPTMSVKRVGHTATLLEDGSVLVTGGETGSGVTASAEILNTTANAAFSLLSMSFARAGHAAALLPNGKVAVTGGSDSAGHTWRQAELYNPSSHSWTAAGNMAHARTSLTMKLLADGNAIAIGGDGHGTSEKYSPTANSWSGLAQMKSVRFSASSVVLPDGRILVAGGIVNTNPVSSAEIFSPATSSWTAAQSMHVARASFSLTVVPGGVMAAGSYSRLGTTNSTEVFHPGNSTWSVGESMHRSRGAQGDAGVPGGSVFEIGGWSGASITSSVEVFGPAAPIPPPKPPPKLLEPIDLVPLVLACKELPGRSSFGLIAKLMAAQAKFELKDFDVCANKMNAFYHQVSGLDNAGKLTDSHVDMLYTAYASVMKNIGESPLPPIT